MCVFVCVCVCQYDAESNILFLSVAVLFLIDCAHLQTGKTIQRAPRKRGAKGATLPSKPDGGWPILVTPLHAGGQRGQPWVAMPDTSRRALTEDEELYLSLIHI